MQNVPVADVSRERDRARRRAVTLAFGVFVMTLVTLIAVGSRTAVQWSLALGIYTWFFASRSKRLVVWLRRFHQGEPGRLRFHRVLGKACSGLAVAVTIQDSTYKTALDQAFGRSVLFYPFTIAGALVPLFAAAIVAITFAETATSMMWIGGIAAVPAMVAYGWSIKAALFRRGVTVLTGGDGVGRAQQEVATIRAGKRTSIGVRVCAVSDAIWQRVVELFLDQAAAVVVDVTSPSDNVLWELSTVEARLTPEAVILAYGHPEGQPPEMPPALRSMLESAIGGERMSRHPVFYYPRTTALVGRNVARLYGELSATLSDELARCVIYAAPSRDAPHGSVSGQRV